MRTKKEIQERLANIKEYLNTIPKQNLLRESERITFAGSSGAVEILEWVLKENK